VGVDPTSASVEPFETDDVDIFAHLPSSGVLIDLSPIHEHFRKLGYPEEGEKIVIEGVPVQILPAAGPLEEEAIRDSVEITLGTEPARHGLLEKWRRFEETARG
jgi:hypothetical protein